MSSRSLLILVAAALLLGLAVVLGTGPDRDTGARGARFLPGLDAALNDVERIVISAAGPRTVATLERDADGFGVRERDGYPADMGRIRKNLIGLAEATIVEPKTAQPALHGRLGVEALDTAGAAGSRLDIEAGDYRASVIIGETGVSGGGMAYVRRADEAQSYMVDADLEPSVNTADWLDDSLTDIPSSRIRRVRIDHPDGETLVLVREGAEATDFTLVDRPEGRELAFPGVANALATALSGLEFDNVEPAADFEAGSAAPVRAEFETFDGLVIEATSFEREDGLRVRFDARAAQGSTAPAEDGSGPAAEARELAGRLGGWIYTLPAYKAEQFTRRIEDMLAPEE